MFKKQKQPELAIVFFKQSVSKFEETGNTLRFLPKPVQESYKKQVAPIYRILADLLIQQDRILEAQQVLDLLKVQELEDYLRNVRGSDEKLVILKPASLWKVSDGGTQVLMNGFYNALKQGKMTKAEALRQAQIALITDDYDSVSGKRAGIVIESVTSEQKQFSGNIEHPYYWAPFILIGNGL
ncbi:MAG: CHAT domain-containing protein [Cyanobacteria bacterium J06635_10]